MTEAGEKDAPLFSYRAYSPFLGLAVGLALFVLWFVWVIVLGGLSSQPRELPTAAAILVFDLALVVLSAFSLSRRVWSMRFYGDRFVARGRGLNSELAYSQIRDVSRFRVFSGFQNRDILSIEVEGGRSFTISGNPRNKELNIDLYSWLGTKAPQRPARNQQE